MENKPSKKAKAGKFNPLTTAEVVEVKDTQSIVIAEIPEQVIVSYEFDEERKFMEDKFDKVIVEITSLFTDYIGTLENCRRLETQVEELNSAKKKVKSVKI
jgi:hypothetical protein